MTVQLILTPNMAFSTLEVEPAAEIVVYKSGTTTPVTVYSDKALTTPIAQPILADGAGKFPQVFSDGAAELKVVITTSEGATIDTLDPVILATSSGSGAGDVGFSPIAGNEATDTQTAIENNTNRFDDYLEVGDKASEAAAIAGTENDTWMSPLRTATYVTGRLSSEAQALAGTDNAALATSLRVQQAVDQAFAASAFGAAQTWQDLSGSRAGATSYQNTEGRTIYVAIAQDTGGNRDVEVSVDDATWVRVGVLSTSASTTVSFAVPDQWYYRVNGTLTTYTWAELS